MAERLRGWLWPLLLLALLLAAWELAVRAWVEATLVQRVVPLPSGIFEQLWAKADVLSYHSGVTLTEIVLGLLIALLASVGLGLLIFYVRTVERALYPLIIFTQNVPVFAIAPLLVIWMGFGIWPKVTVAALIAFFPIVVAVVDGLRSTDEELVQLFTILGANRWRQLRHLHIPSALPHVFSGLKVGVTLSVVGAVVGEWVGPNAGLGHLMLTEKRLLHVDTVFAAIVWLSALGLLLFGAVTLLEAFALRWKRVSANRYNRDLQKENF